MTAYKQMVLGREALMFLQARVNTGLPLAKEVLAHHDLTRGTVWTVVPATVSQITARDLAEGGVFRPPTPEDWLFDVVRKHLSVASDRVCVLEDAVGRSSDPWRTTLALASRQVTYGDYVYFALCAQDTDTARIEAAFHEASSAWITLGFMATLPAAWRPQSACFSRKDLSDMADTTEKLIVDAYDGEGWLVWERA